MSKKILAAVIVCVLTLTVGFPASALANSATDKRARFADKVKAGVIRLGTGADARVEVKLRDKTKLSGYVSEANEGSFVVTDAKLGTNTVVAYPDVAQVRGNNLSTGQKVLIGAAITAGVLAIIYFAFFAGKHL